MVEIFEDILGDIHHCSLTIIRDVIDKGDELVLICLITVLELLRNLLQDGVLVSPVSKDRSFVFLKGLLELAYKLKVREETLLYIYVLW